MTPPAAAGRTTGVCLRGSNVRQVCPNPPVNQASYSRALIVIFRIKNLAYRLGTVRGRVPSIDSYRTALRPRTSIRDDDPDSWDGIPFPVSGYYVLNGGKTGLANMYISLENLYFC
jgi:hypothetical protein